MMRCLLSRLRLGNYLLTGSLIGSMWLMSPAKAQQFDFSRPSTLEPPGPSQGVPLMPVLPQANGSAPTSGTQPLGNPAPGSPLPSVLPPVPTTIPNVIVAPSTGTVPPPPIPVVPSVPTDAYSYQRLPGATPGAPVNNPTGQGQLTRGSIISLTVFREITFPPFQAINGNLEVTSPIIDRFGQVVVPVGSVIWGSFQPVYETRARTNAERGNDLQVQQLVGSRFVANRITVGAATYALKGESDILPVGSDPRTDMGTVALRGAGYGAAGGLALGLMTGGLGLLPIFAGGIAGAAAGASTVDQVVTLRPNLIVNVRLTDDLILH